ncbi:four-carbon acid sugar kinase family protein [Anabaena cylindrica FACHB-243]|uniref:Type III effector Hrp-dependent outer n=1 Tax=Anabaena cylindrica (strain ATCC 27899 / PCC 7122) TaxID=272123 RepID=K9ZBE6_ANACC|nr:MULTISPECIES: four-carbon acid sugar kinase family protein [Anabaena]AFZ56511.1 type III effector Hrp-dependent outer [Anabaena cylindrica PCC 7122]MBD2418547.1 four-carbon acid sugar kinase family protein [Anabaena cylindrica FACHB-243]MBY5284182.1 four-carbon acid sugar kinase family protein [Anabaena sp. CCAP 1446/1C]MBY5310869.1 four-carbon acid sugar kinase family protein [Anabaena sp. CCAP 1446/1C]MCM2409939.1 four-carbon acid sugar kinase family protein [Anabaena sp. CCAP 1446/1C]
MNNKPKIIVLDDDPTGSQTVHSCLLLMRWDVETLRLGLKDDAPIFFILTNTRSLTPESAAAVTREVCQNLKLALAAEKIDDFLVVSRSDSTLRGHYPIETDVIAEELGPFDAHFLVPAFFVGEDSQSEGGRITRDSIHYLIIDGVPTPVHETEFARDSVFGYNYSYLPKYVEEKTKGRIKENTVTRFLLADIRAGSLERLLQLHDNQCGVVDGETQTDLNTFALEILTAASRGKRFLFRSAASILKALAALPPQPIAAENMAEYVRGGKPGAVIVGSHVKKTTQQLASLLQVEGTVGIEVEVGRLVDDGVNESAKLLTEILESVQAVHNAGKTPVVYTSRQELSFKDVKTRLDFGVKVSTLLMDVVQGLPSDIGFLISKGGITSNDVLSTGLALTSARLLGQILAGCSMVLTPSNHPQFPNLPVVLFPGNVGNADALATSYQRLTAKGIGN